MGVNCPNCGTMMVEERAQGVKLDVCPNCEGIWLSSDELKGLLASGPQGIAQYELSHKPRISQQHAGPSHLLCPVNQVLMDQYHYMYNSPVVIHACSDCGGMFVESSQLPLMEQWYQQVHEPMTKEELTRVEAGMDAAQHEAFMLRQSRLQGMFNTLSTYQPGWSGFFP